MVNQYPDTGVMPGITAEAVLGSDGVYSPGDSTPDIIVHGRYEPSTLNREVQLTDGTIAKVKGIFYMPLSEANVPSGVVITVTDKDGNIILKTNVLFFTRGQLNCRVYL